MLYTTTNNNKYKNLPILVIAFFCPLFFIFAAFGISVDWVVIIASGLVLSFVIIQFNYIVVPISLKKANCVLLVVCATILLNIRSIDYLKSNPMYIYAMCVVVLILLLTRINDKTKKAIANIILFWAIVSAFVVFFSRAFSDVYIEYIRKHFQQEIFNRIFGFIRDGYSGSIGEEISLTCHCLAWGIFVCFSRCVKRIRIRYCVLFVIFSTALIATNRRSEFLATAIAFVIMLYLVSNKRNKKRFLIMLFVVLLLLGMLLLIIYAGLIKYNGTNRLLITFFDFLQGKDISNGRISLYETAWKLFCENPVFGIGWGGFHEYGRTINVTNVHNCYLQLLCETGIVGTVILLGAIIYLFKSVWRRFKNDRRNIYSIIALLAIIYILILGFVDNPFFQDHSWFFIGFIIYFTRKPNSTVKKLEV